RLFIPGPTDVHPDTLAAQNRSMIGHRGADFEALFARIQPKLRQVFFTNNRVYISTSSGTGLQEASVRNCVAHKVLCCINGAFSERWYEVAVANGKEVTRLDVEWGHAVKPDQIDAALKNGGFDAITLVHNETSTGVVSPIKDIAAVLHDRYPEVTILIDAVSSLGGDKLDFDGWGLDVLLTSSQKCFAVPPGLAFAAVSDRALAKAKGISNRGLYFDFVDLEKYLLKNQTPATPAISLMWALDAALDRMLAEGLDARFARHAQMADRVRGWAEQQFDLFAEPGYRSHTVTCVKNTRSIDVKALNTFLKSKGMQLSDGYGDLKGHTFRIAHMGEIRMEDVAELLACIDEFLMHNA
ncbi:MAG TPA: alanine--glyoxylate aminotransferase family protein, partial [Anaerolineae bacterium]|nr:alanine--glyoxylate aminotransferase family protein [Anaerolineae bacterium]